MEPQGNKLAYIAGALGLVLFLILLGWFIFSPKKVVSPLPDEGIKVIFNTPEETEEPVSESSPSAEPQSISTEKPKSSVKPNATAE